MTPRSLAETDRDFSSPRLLFPGESTPDKSFALAFRESDSENPLSSALQAQSPAVLQRSTTESSGKSRFVLFHIL
jgi:hypothetical protein